MHAGIAYSDAKDVVRANYDVVTGQERVDEDIRRLDPDTSAERRKIRQDNRNRFVKDLVKARIGRAEVTGRPVRECYCDRAMS